jgi:hypothetical protein
MLRWGLAAACCIAIASCAAGGKPASMTPSSEAPASTGGAAPEVLPASAHDRIDKLYTELGTDRDKLALAEPSDMDVQGQRVTPMGSITAATDTKCHPAKTDTCTTSCTLADSICTNADKICNLAQSIPGDGWAQNKCAKANKTCDTSHAKCCSCQ